MKSCRGGRRRPMTAHLRSRAGLRKSSPVCRYPMSRRRWRCRVRHRARRGRRHLPAHAGSDSPSASGRRGWHIAAGRAGRSGCRPAGDRAAPCRVPFRHAPAAPAAPAIRASREPLRAQAVRPAVRRWFRRPRPPRCRSRCRAAPTIAARVRRRRCFQPASAIAASPRPGRGTARRLRRCLPATPLRFPSARP